jgi:PTH1 family peptidyl-tRNA hydrolase
VLNDFAKSERGWLSDLLDAVSDAAPYLAKGDDSRFLSDVAKTLYAEPAPKKTKDASEDEARPPAKKPASTSHPSGERSSKRQSALAENLKKWLGARKSGDGDA